MKPVKLFTAGELNPFLASVVNTRFNSFLLALSTKLDNKDYEMLLVDAKAILEDAEIEQD